MRNMLLTVLSASVLAGTYPARAVDYYVAQQDPAADDRNVGTENRPLRSFAAGVRRLKPGDRLLIKDGVYRPDGLVGIGSDTESFAGSPERPTYIMAAEGHRPVVKGSRVVSGRFRPVRVALRKTDKVLANIHGFNAESFREVVGIDTRNVKVEVPDYVQQASDLDHTKAGFVGIYVTDHKSPAEIVLAGGEMLRQIGFQGNRERSTRDSFRLKNEWYGKDVSDMEPGSFHHDVERRKLYVWLRDGADPNAAEIESAVSTRLLYVYRASYVTIRGIEFRHVRDGAKGGDIAAVTVQGDHITVEDCVFSHAGFAALSVSGRDLMLRNSEIAYGGVCGLTGTNIIGMRIEGNGFHDNNFRGDVTNVHSGNKLTDAVGVTAMRNTFRNENAPAFWLDINCHDALVAENTFENCAAVAIHYEISRWGVIANNIIRDSSTGLWVYSSDTLVAHNVFDGCGEAIRLTSMPRCCFTQRNSAEKRGYTLHATRNNLFVNNLLINCPGSYVTASPESIHGYGNYFEHNVFAWLGDVPVHWGGNHIKFMIPWDQYIARWGMWARRMNYDHHSVIADPKLLDLVRSGNGWAHLQSYDLVGDPKIIDRASVNYRLSADSPLRGKGVTIPVELNAGFKMHESMDEFAPAYARTALDDAPPHRRTERARVYGIGHYRMQPLPRVRMLVDLAAQEPGDPGLNTTWLETGRYPRFRDAEPAGVADDVYCVGPENRIGDPELTGQPTLPEGMPDVTGEWHRLSGNVGRRHGALYVNVHAYNRPPNANRAVQKVGIIGTDTEYVLLCQIRADCRVAGLVSRADIALAVGPSLRIVARANASGTQSRSYMKPVELRIDSAASPELVGQPLYILLGGGVTGEENSPVPLIAQLRWQNLCLHTGSTDL